MSVAAASRPGALKGSMITSSSASSSSSDDSSSCMRGNSSSSASSNCNYINDDTCDNKSSLNANVAVAVAGGESQSSMTVAADRMLIEGNLLDRQTGQGLTSFFDLKMNTAFASRRSNSDNGGIVGFEYEYCIYSLQFGNFKLNLSSGMTVTPSFHEVKALQEKRTKGDDFSISIVIPSRIGSKTKRNVLILRPYSLPMYTRWHKLLRESIIETCFHEIFQFLMGENNKLDYSSFMNLVEMAIANCKELGEDTNLYLLRLKFIWNALIEIQEIVETINKYNSKDENDKDPYSVLVEEIVDVLERTQKEPIFELHGQVHMIKSFYEYILIERERKARSTSIIDQPTTPTISMAGLIQKPKALSSSIPNKKSFFRRPTAEIVQSHSPSLSLLTSDATIQLLNDNSAQPFLNPNQNNNVPIKTPLKDTQIVSMKQPSNNIHANNTSSSSSNNSKSSSNSNFNGNSSNISSNIKNSNFTSITYSNINSSTKTSAITLTASHKQELQVKFDEDSENMHPNSPNKKGCTKPSSSSSSSSLSSSVFLNTSMLISKPLSTEGSAARLENPMQIASRPARPPLKKISQFVSQVAPVDNAGSSKAAAYFEKFASAFKRSDNNLNIDPNGATLTDTANSFSKYSSPMDFNEPVVVKSCSPATATINTADIVVDAASTSFSRVSVSGDNNNVYGDSNSYLVESSNNTSSTKTSPVSEERMTCVLPSKLIKTSSSVTAISKNEDLSKIVVSKNETSISLKGLKKNLLNDFNDNMLDIHARRSKVVSVLMSRSNQIKESFTPMKTSNRLLGLEEGVFQVLLGQFSVGCSSNNSQSLLLNDKSHTSPLSSKPSDRMCDMIPSRSLVLYYRKEVKKYQQFKVLMLVSLFLLHCYRYRQTGCINNNQIKRDNNLILYMWSILIKRKSRKTNTNTNT